MKALRIFLAGAFFLWSALPVAATGWVINPYSFGAPPPPTMTRGTCVASTANGATYNGIDFQSTGTGASDADSVLVIVGVFGVDSAITFGVSSMAIDGVAATEIVDENGTGTVDAAFYRASAPSTNNATVNVSVSFTEQVTSAVACAWALKDLASSTPDSSVADDDASSGALILTLGTTNATGFVFGICGNAATGVTTTWANVTERQDTCHAEACYSNADGAATGSSMAITCDWTGTGNASGAAVAFH